ncbi:MAG: glycosyltransferase family 1 protein [Verrucomicrobia bacterium]|nr:glycosyltransferase family 1 protein [Verrucomicrobiota bacterium]
MASISLYITTITFWNAFAIGWPNNEQREEIVAAGRAEVLKKHTYDHRVNEIIQTVTRF